MATNDEGVNDPQERPERITLQISPDNEEIIMERDSTSGDYVASNDGESIDRNTLMYKLDAYLRNANNIKTHRQDGKKSDDSVFIKTITVKESGNKGKKEITDVDKLIELASGSGKQFTGDINVQASPDPARNVPPQGRGNQPPQI